jgi:hypothetical protein
MAPARPQAEADIQEANAPTALPDAAGQVAGLLPEPGAAPGDDTFLVGLGGEELRTPGPVAALAAHLTPARAVATPDVKALLTRDPAGQPCPKTAGSTSGWPPTCFPPRTATTPGSV